MHPLSKSFKQTQIHLSQHLPHLGSTKNKNARVIIDQKLLKQPAVKKWLKNFPKSHCIPVTAGEELKSLKSFCQIITDVVQKSAHLAPQTLSIIAVGGGSVGDFGGLIAHLLKRGVRLIHIPSTWLAAIDSAHGGKTALNVGGYKNQIGTFYPADSTYLVKELLLTQPPELAHQALSELIKIALIEGGTLWKKILHYSSSTSLSSSEPFLLSLLLPAVQAKLKVVRKDPYESKGIRHILNLGHTVGHFFEAHYKVSHGEAVAQGLLFALDWSLYKKELRPSYHQQIMQVLERLNIQPQHFKPVPSQLFEKYISQDKKMSSYKKVRFVFIHKPGQARVKVVPLRSLVLFAQKYGIVKYTRQRPVQ